MSIIHLSYKTTNIMSLHIQSLYLSTLWSTCRSSKYKLIMWSMPIYWEYWGLENRHLRESRCIPFFPIIIFIETRLQFRYLHKYLNPFRTINSWGMHHEDCWNRAFRSTGMCFFKNTTWKMKKKKWLPLFFNVRLFSY